MYGEEDCGCGRHGQHHGERYSESQEGWHGHHGMPRGWHHHGCRCGCHHHEGMGFHRHFIPREEIIARLEEYLKQLQAEAKGVEEHIDELKKKIESQQA